MKLPSAPLLLFGCTLFALAGAAPQKERDCRPSECNPCLGFLDGEFICGNTAARNETLTSNCVSGNLYECTSNGRRACDWGPSDTCKLCGRPFACD